MAMEMVVVALLVLTLNLRPNSMWVAAQLHHVIGDDRGWDPAVDVVGWSSGRTFKVGDKIWFAHAADESVAELRTAEDYESCDVSNPIRMYTSGLIAIPLDEEGARYFASGEPETCKGGLKLHIDVVSRGTPASTVQAAAVAPSSPSGSIKLSGISMLLSLAFILYCCYLFF